jgi:two-component system, NtrC family, sensor histidine kinase KinB
MQGLGIRQKLLFGFGGLAIILAIIGYESITLLTQLGQSIDVILRENYRSVIACQGMKDAMERMDGGILFSLLGYKEEGRREIKPNTVRFEQALKEEFSAIAVEGEAEKASHIQEMFEQYRKTMGHVLDESSPFENRKRVYFQEALPLFRSIKDAAQEILKLNQDSMTEANDRARAKAAASLDFMVALLFSAACVTATFVLFIGKWMLRPIGRLTESAQKIQRGSLDVVVPEESTDEIGQLSRAFNAMASSLREFRRIDHVNLVRVQRSIEQAFRHLPDAVAVFDLQGIAEVTTESAKTIFEITPGTDIGHFPLERLGLLFRQALRSGSVADPEDGVVYIQRFVNGEERYFRPKAVPILDSDGQPTGVILILADVTQEWQQEEAKRGIIATVSHQLKTPLTSIRMAIHLLLDKKVGPLSDKQSSLLLAAKDEVTRLSSIIEQLLQIRRIESGRLLTEFSPVSPIDLITEAADGFRKAAGERGISISVQVPEDLPAVAADKVLIIHVLANLLSNAVNYSDAGGRITITAKARKHDVCFSVKDTGRGIPKQYLEQILEQFFRVPGQEGESGAGLGLAIVKQIVEAHHGVVTVRSREGKGSTFTFSLIKYEEARAEG